MWEDVYQIYRRAGEYVELIASDMSLSNATMFMEAWMCNNYADQISSLELRRQPINREERDTE